jgi:excisionase family DNA binding protein
MPSGISNETTEKKIPVLIFDNLKWMTSKEAAFYLRVSVGQIRNMVYRSQIRCYRVNNRLRFLRSDLDRVLKSQIGGQTW